MLCALLVAAAAGGARQPRARGAGAGGAGVGGLLRCSPLHAPGGGAALRGGGWLRGQRARLGQHGRSRKRSSTACVHIIMCCIFQFCLHERDHVLSQGGFVPSAGSGGGAVLLVASSGSTVQYGQYWWPTITAFSMTLCCRASPAAACSTGPWARPAPPAAPPAAAAGPATAVAAVAAAPAAPAAAAGPAAAAPAAAAAAA